MFNLVMFMDLGPIHKHYGGWWNFLYVFHAFYEVLIFFWLTLLRYYLTILILI